MKFIKRILLSIFASILWLFVFLIITAFVGQFNKPPFKSLSAEPELPKYFPFVAHWPAENGVTHCRAFWAFQLDDLITSVPLVRFELTPDSVLACHESIGFLKQNEQWPVIFEWDQKSRWPFVFLELLEEQVISVSYSPDDDLVNRSKYRVVNNTIHDAEYQSYFGPGVAIAAMPYSFALTMLLWFLNSVRKKCTKRKADSSEIK